MTGTVCLVLKLQRNRSSVVYEALAKPLNYTKLTERERVFKKLSKKQKKPQIYVDFSISPTLSKEKVLNYHGLYHGLSTFAHRTKIVVKN